MILVLIGVSGSGKSVVGRAAAERFGWPFVDADDLHSPANKEKMRSGVPLTDADRLPWLESLRDAVRAVPESGSLVLVFSGLKKSYRELVRDGRKDVRFVLLDGSFDLIASRLAVRKHEFMNPALLKSQFDTLERPEPDEQVAMLSVEPELEAVLDGLERLISEERNRASSTSGNS